MHKAILCGNLGADPEVRNVTGDTVCNMRLATKEHYKDREGERKERTDWHSVQAWGPQGESCGKYLKKGSKILVEGQIQTRSYEKDGQKRYATEIRAMHVEFLDGKRDDGDAREPDERSGERDNRGGGYRAPAQSGGQRREEPARREDRGRGFQ